MNERTRDGTAATAAVVMVMVVVVDGVDGTGRPLGLGGDLDLDRTGSTGSTGSAGCRERARSAFAKTAGTKCASPWPASG
jgi:hypothetical protein